MQHFRLLPDSSDNERLWFMLGKTGTAQNPHGEITRYLIYASLHPPREIQRIAYSVYIEKAGGRKSCPQVPHHCLIEQNIFKESKAIDLAKLCVSWKLHLLMRVRRRY